MNHSRQRDLILNYLQNTTSHPTAEEVYQNVRVENPDISLGTVYRNLNQLAENGMIRRIHLEDGVDHFDADLRNHLHFLCNSCKRITDLRITLPDRVRTMLRETEGMEDLRVDGCMLYFYGLCEDCKRKDSLSNQEAFRTDHEEHEEQSDRKEK